MLNDETPPAQIAKDLGISLGHLRQVLRRHPLPRPRRPVRCTLIPAPEPATRPTGQQPGVIYLDPAWLCKEYLTWHRSLDDIAAQAGCTIQTLNRFARDHGIPVRNRSTSTYMPASSAPGVHPRDLPEPLRSALTGCCPALRDCKNLTIPRALRRTAGLLDQRGPRRTPPAPGRLRERNGHRTMGARPLPVARLTAFGLTARSNPVNFPFFPKVSRGRKVQPRKSKDAGPSHRWRRRESRQ
jgi:hypothetical protein